MKNRILALLVLSLFLSGCSSTPSVSPESYGARVGEEGAKYWKQQNPGLIAPTNAAGAYCASMAEEGGKEYGWTYSEIMQAADSCSIWFTTEMFRK